MPTLPDSLLSHLTSTDTIAPFQLCDTCIIIEQSLGRPLLWLACRHHIHEIVLKDTYEFLFRPPPGLKILLFKQFRGRWDFLDKTTFGTLSDDFFQVLLEIWNFVNLCDQ